MTPKEYLCRYHNILEKIKIKKEYIEFCKDREKSISSPSYDPMPKSPNIDTEAPFVKWMIKRKTAEEELVELVKESNLIKQETERTIMSLNNESYEMILVMRYLDWKTWEDISSKLYSSPRTLRRRHDEAIKLIEVFIKS